METMYEMGKHGVNRGLSSPFFLPYFLKKANYFNRIMIGIHLALLDPREDLFMTKKMIPFLIFSLFAIGVGCGGSKEVSNDLPPPPADDTSATCPADCPEGTFCNLETNLCEAAQPDITYDPITADCGEDEYYDTAAGGCVSSSDSPADEPTDNFCPYACPTGTICDEDSNSCVEDTTGGDAGVATLTCEEGEAPIDGVCVAVDESTSPPPITTHPPTRGTLTIQDFVESYRNSHGGRDPWWWTVGSALSESVIRLEEVVSKVRDCSTSLATLTAEERAIYEAVNGTGSPETYRLTHCMDCTSELTALQALMGTGA
ncbi:MAG: hypothetical protein Q7S00_07440, partial [bacterium]|nr:hypothetical protein [bacterium]